MVKGVFECAVVAAADIIKICQKGRIILDIDLQT
jgi:hypothetical protein